VLLVLGVCAVLWSLLCGLFLQPLFACCSFCSLVRLVLAATLLMNILAG